jgi:hypothetical protein
MTHSDEITPQTYLSLARKHLRIAERPELHRDSRELHHDIAAIYRAIATELREFPDSASKNDLIHADVLIVAATGTDSTDDSSTFPNLVDLARDWVQIARETRRLTEASTGHSADEVAPEVAENRSAA